MFRTAYFNRFALLIGMSILSSFFFVSTIQAQPPIAQRLCRRGGRYVVFAQRPLGNNVWKAGEARPRGTFADRNNIQRAHEHIFFCNNGQVEDNLGFGLKNLQNAGWWRKAGAVIVGGDGERFSIPNESIPKDFVLIDDERYDTDLIKKILGPTQCVSDSNLVNSKEKNYHAITNNCQDFTARVRQIYWRRILQGIWIAKGYQCPFGTLHTQLIAIQVSSKSLVATKLNAAGDKCVPTGFRTFSGEIPNKVSKGSTLTINFVTGTPNNPASGTSRGKLKIVDSNTLYSGGSTGESITFRRLR